MVPNNVNGVYPRTMSTPVNVGSPYGTYPINPYQQIFVQGIEGAKAFQMPYGVTAVILWDTEKDLFYLKRLDEMGRPYIAKTCSYADYEEPVPEETVRASAPVNTDGFVTKDYFDSVIKRLSVGERGRIVIDESNE